MAPGGNDGGALGLVADQPEIFALGNASIDVTLNVPRLPVAGETLIASGMRRAPGGKGLNQAVMAARAGARVRFCAPLGPEPEAALVRQALAAEPFARLELLETDCPTDLSTLMVGADGENMIVSTGDCAAGVTPDRALAFITRMRATDWLLVQGNLTEAATWAAVARARKVMFNTAPIRWHSARILAAATVVVANQGEAEAITGERDPSQAAARLGGAIGIVTLGAGGCVVARGEQMFHLPAPRVHPVDSSGAGDVFCGVLAAGLAGGSALEAAIGHAQAAAALAVSRAGCFTAFPDAAELQAILRPPRS